MKNAASLSVGFVIAIILMSCDKDLEKEQVLIPEVMASMADTFTTSPADVYNTLFTRYGGGWTGGDGVYSIPLGGNRTLWTFGDTFLDTVYPDRSRPGSPLYRNTFAVQKKNKFITLYGGTEEEPEAMVNTDDPDNDWYWPLDGIVYDGTLYIFMANFVRTGTGMWDFHYVKTDRVAFSLPGFNELERVTVWTGGDVAFGAAILQEEDYIYIYSTEDVPYTRRSHVARVPADDFLAEWEFFDGEGWTTDFPESDGWMKKGGSDVLYLDVSNQFSVFYENGFYRLVTQEGFLGPDIHTYQSENPYGPWQYRKKLYTTPETGGDVWTYNALMHPEIRHPATNAILMSYCVNTQNFWDLFSNANLYRPYFVWVEYPD